MCAGLPRDTQGMAIEEKPMSARPQELDPGQAWVPAQVGRWGGRRCLPERRRLGVSLNHPSRTIESEIDANPEGYLAAVH